MRGSLCLPPCRSPPLPDPRIAVVSSVISPSSLSTSAGDCLGCQARSQEPSAPEPLLSPLRYVREQTPRHHLASLALPPPPPLPQIPSDPAPPPSTCPLTTPSVKLPLPPLSLYSQIPPVLWEGPHLEIEDVPLLGEGGNSVGSQSTRFREFFPDPHFITLGRAHLRISPRWADTHRCVWSGRTGDSAGAHTPLR